MIITTRKQREALKRIYDRGPIWAKDSFRTTCDSAYGVGKPLSYREFRKRLEPAYDCVMIHWAGMWLGIEKNGYVHS